jgi:putative sterol carrier protein
MPRIESVDQVFKAMAEDFDGSQWGESDVTLLFDITGEGGGKWAATIRGGEISVDEGAANNPTTTITCSATDLLGIVNGEVNPVTAFMQGRIKIDGDMALALKLQSLLGS